MVLYIQERWEICGRNIGQSGHPREEKSESIISLQLRKLLEQWRKGALGKLICSYLYEAKPLLSYRVTDVRNIEKCDAVSARFQFFSESHPNVEVAGEVKRKKSNIRHTHSWGCQ
jgi:hypothetical protein